jgi:hypothetical protein
MTQLTSGPYIKRKENCKAPFWQQHTSLEHKHSLHRHNTIIKVKKGSSGFQDYVVLSPTMKPAVLLPGGQKAKRSHGSSSHRKMGIRWLWHHLAVIEAAHQLDMN